METIKINTIITHKIKVTVVDINQDRIDAWNSESLPIYEPGLDEVVKAARGRNLFFSSDVDRNVSGFKLVWVKMDLYKIRFQSGNNRN